jgi:hypothetical protein
VHEIVSTVSCRWPIGKLCASFFDLETFQTQAPILFQDGYPRSVAVAHGGIWATVRVVSPPASVTCNGGPTSNPLYRVDFFSRTANAPPTLGIYCNQAPADSVLSSTPSENYILLALPDGTVAMWDAGINTWVVSRTNTGSVAGAFGAFNDNLFVVGNSVLDPGLFPVATAIHHGRFLGRGPLGQFASHNERRPVRAPSAANLNTLVPFHGR